MKKADAAFIAQPAPAPDNAPSAGLLYVVGSVGGEEVSGGLDALVDLVAQLQANGSNPTHIVVDPLGWSELRKLKFGSDSNQSLLGAGTTDATPMLLSLPVIVNREVPPYSGVVVDRSAVVSAVGPVTMATDNSVFFVSDSIALRATWRIGHNVVRPDRIGQFTTAAPGS